MSRAEKYIEDVWANDGGAVEETARRGLADADRAELVTLYGDDADDVGAALVALCRSRRPDVVEPA